MSQSSPMLQRRGFLALGGASAAGMLVAGCGGDDDGESTQTQPGSDADVTLNFALVTGVLNYAYALEQLEAAFYAQVMEDPPSGIDGQERRVFADIAAHEEVHRRFLKAVLGDDAIEDLEPNFEAVDFSDRDSVVRTALTFENLGVGAYNGAARFIDARQKMGATALMAAGDIVAVEARHAAIIGSLANVGRDGQRYAPTAFDTALMPATVLEDAQPFIKQRIRLQKVETRAGA